MRGGITGGIRLWRDYSGGNLTAESQLPFHFGSRTLDASELVDRLSLRRRRVKSDGRQTVKQNLTLPSSLFFSSVTDVL